VLFINASAEVVRHGNKNKLSEGNRKKILDTFAARTEVNHFSRLVSSADIAANGYNISVSSYVEAEDRTEAVDINVLNAEIASIVSRQQELRHEIDAIVGDLDGGQ
jgi:type I restriction enzyme M protein